MAILFISLIFNIPQLIIEQILTDCGIIRPYVTYIWGNIGPSHYHDDVIKWKHFLCYWPFVRGFHRSPVNSPHKGQWCGALIFSLICTWIKGWVNNCEPGDLRRHRAHHDVTVMTVSVLLCHTEVQWHFLEGSFTGSVKDINTISQRPMSKCCKVPSGMTLYCLRQKSGNEQQQNNSNSN